MSLFTIKFFVNNLTAETPTLVTSETILSLSFALGQLMTERDAYCVPIHHEVLYQQSKHLIVVLGNRGHRFIN